MSETAHVRREGSRVVIPQRRMYDLLMAVYRAIGCSCEEADIVTSHLIGANLRGHDSHGVIRTPRYVEWVEQGKMLPNQSISVEIENDVIAIVSGNYGFGQTVALQTVDVGIDKARANGVAVTGLKEAGHVGRVGAWSERAAAANCVSIHMVNVRGSLIVAPFGAIERRGSTSPFSAGIPMPDGEDPIILDFATSTVAEGKALVALRGGKELPHGAVITGDGKLTSDPGYVYGELSPNSYPSPYNGAGALTSFGLHKGSGLNFFMEMFAGCMTGCGTAGALGEPERRRFSNGMFSIYMAMEYFHSDDWFANEVRSYIEFFKSARPVEPDGEVLIPGEKELLTKAQRETYGLPLSPQVWADLHQAAKRAGLSEAAILEFTGESAVA